MYLKFAKVRKVVSPKRANSGADAGVDLFVPEDFLSVDIYTNQSVTIPSGIKFEVPAGYAMILFNKSGIASKRSLIVGACVIDHGYSGEVHINMINVGQTVQRIEPGMKIVQALVLPIIVPEFLETTEDNLYQDIHNASVRGTGGLGSTGVTS